MTARRLSLASILLASLLVVMMSFLFHQGYILLMEQRPMIEAAEKIKLHATAAHLWFEEIASGDQSESIEDVWEGLEQADWYSEALLSGGTNEEGTFYPLADERMRLSIEKIQQAIQEFREIALLRYERLGAEKPGSALDEQSDRVFHQLILQAANIEESLKKHIEVEFTKYRYISFFLILFSVLISIYLSRFLYREEKDKTELVTSLNLAKYSIEEKNKELQRRAHYDPLTGLPNRVLFIDRLEQVIIHAMRSDLSVAVLFIDLDHFKSINDNYGHQKGDLLLQSVANRINQCIRESDTAARISGDEFVVILSDLLDVNHAMKAANKVAESIVESLRQSYQLGEVTVDISASIGVALYPDDSTSSYELVRYADSAMYHAKTLGKNNFQFYSRELHHQSMKQMEMEQDLKGAVKYDQFELHFQPQWDLATGKVKGLEALVRWKHPTHGLIYPDEFIGIAEACGLIQQLDSLVTSKALKQQKEWRERGLNFGAMCINVSPVCFRRSDFFRDISQIISQSGIEPGLIELEITESLLVENDKHAQKLFADLKSLGVRIALDDFGTGYSSMSYLKDFRFDTLKIDRSFVADYSKSEISTIVLKNILTLGHDLGLNVVAEGIETEEQEAHLRSLGCTTGQGYLLTKPLDAQALECFLVTKEGGNILKFERA